MNKIHVIGIGFRPLDKKAVDAVLGSDVVLVNSRLLDVFKGYEEYEHVRDRIVVHPGVYETIDYIGENYQTKRLSLLAAGDPMFFGIGRLIVEKFGRGPVEVFPDLSSIQVAFSRIRETSNNALLISLHGGPDPAKRRKLEYEVADIPGLIERNDKIAILTDRENSPAEIAKEILKQSASGKGERTLPLQVYVCEKLGYPDEKITAGTPEEIGGMSFEHPNVVIIVGAYCNMPLPVFGLRETEIRHSRGMITKDEVRAATIHRLRLTEKGVFWDIGAGSGSVSIEAARLCSALRVYSIEKSREHIKYLNENKDKFKTGNMEIITGEAPDALSGLPDADRAFIGGSGGKLKGIVDVVSEKMSSGVVVINATTIETLNEAVQCLDKNGFRVDISEVSVSRAKTIGQKRHMSALNPVFIITGEKLKC
ncbi:MAG: precorrin-6y C5,15-methyltransferase (decarboxylating) subunit CbiE [Thermodesulfovibrionia bacterium]|nr:precorrin-6y C5,15-methyltransferase (decarboxylating) subunit CbiE [Thermodesulfovibrionia bacterium]